MTARERTAHSTTQAFGLGLIAAAMVVVSVLTLVMFDGDDIGLFGLIAVVSVALTWVVWRFDRLWARILGIVGSLFAGLSAFFLAFGVFQPFSPLEFIVGLAFVLGFFISLVSGIMAVVAGMRHRLSSTSGGRRFRRGVLGLLGLAAVVSIVGFILTRSTVDEAEASGAATVEMANFEFEPQTMTVSSGQDLLVANSDAFAHDFTLEQFDIEVHLGPGSEAIVDLSRVPPGSYDYFCSLHIDPSTGEGMTGQITVEG